MTITYPLTFPTVTGIATIQIKPLSIVGSSRSIYTFEEQIQVHQGQAWAADVTLPNMKRVSGEIWIAFLLSLNAEEGTFLMCDPTGQTPQGSASSAPGTPLVNGSSQTGNTLALKGAPAGVSGYLLKGDYIQLGSGTGTHLHRLLNEADTDSAGDVTMDIWPNLRESPADGAGITVTNTKGLFRLDGQVVFPTDTSSFYTLSFSCVEALG